MNPAPSQPRTRRWPAIAAAGLLVLAVAAVYWNSLRVPFHFDDEPAVVHNPSIRALHPLREVLNPPASGAGVTGRPLVNLSLALNYAAGRLDARGYHVTNTALHALVALALWGVLRRTLRQLPRVARPEPLAWAIALLWAVHPLLTESVVCIVQRNEIMGGLCYLLTLLAFIRSTEGGAAHRGWQAWSVAACLTGMACKEIVATAPLLVLLYDRTFTAGSFAGAWRLRRRYYVALGATWVPLAWLMAGNDQRAGTVGYGLGMSAWDYLLTQCRALTVYLKLSFWPHPLVVDYGMDVSRLPEVWWRGLIVLALLGGTVWALVRKPAWGFPGAWFFVILAPSSSIVPLTTQTIAEHRMYLPLMAVMAGAAVAMQRGTGRQTAVVVTALAVLCGALTVLRNRDYRSAFALWADTVAQVPANARAQLNFGQVLFTAGDVTAAAGRFAEALRLRPAYAEAHYNQGLALSRLGRAQDAIAHYEEALRLAPDYAVAHNDLGIAYAEAGRTAEAERQFEAAVQSRADFAGAHVNLANLLLRTGRTAGAIAHHRQAVKINPASADYQNRLALVLMQSGRPREAVEHYAAAVRLDPATPELQLSFALALAATGQLREAVAHAEEAVRLKPDFPAARHYLAEMQADLAQWEAKQRP
jgi:tetratricopeptide (TPR) repeat protein